MSMSEAVAELYRHRENFIIIGLTGRTGSGCSTVANTLTQAYNDIILGERLEDDCLYFKQEKKRIVQQFAEKNWKPFTTICVRDVISTYILECRYDEINDYLASIDSQYDLDSIKNDFLYYKDKSECLSEIYRENHDAADPRLVYEFITKELPNFTNKFKTHVDSILQSSFIKIYQTIGNNIRRHGDAIERDEIFAQHIYSLSHRINQIIKVLRHYNANMLQPDYFVIDAFRNKVEINFFQERYAAFYLFAITCDEEHRKDRLLYKSIPYERIESIDSKEYSRKNIMSDYNSFISQDISGCIEIADVYIKNNGKHDNVNYCELNEQLITYISLIKHPGLVTPSVDELNMQIAFTAKFNSGCISRQVGAVIADKEGRVLSIGWNDTPKGQIPCLLRCADGLERSTDERYYSKYEQETIPFKQSVLSYRQKLLSAREKGLTITYCFKNFKNMMDNDKNQVYTRSIHAEESAFLSLIDSAQQIKGGTLYTTASPCVLCAKKAYHLGIKEVVYIDPYPDISFDHIFSIGSSRVIHRLFSGAIGTAYHRLYQPIISFKDELSAWEESE